MPPLTICAVFAHPDDESFGVAGTLARYAACGVQTVLVCATHGEAGMTNGLASTPAALAVLRDQELACAARAMGLSECLILDYPDGAGATWDRPKLASELEAIMRRVMPAVVITFDANGVTRHPDHIAIHEVTRDVVIGRAGELGVRRLYYQVVTCPEQASPEGPELACVPPESVDFCVDIARYERAKRDALSCHRSQSADTLQMLQLPSGALAVEHYQLGWAAGGWRPADGETDLLTGL